MAIKVHRKFIEWPSLLSVMFMNTLFQKKYSLSLGGGGGGFSAPFDAATLILFHIFFQIAEIPQGRALEYTLLGK